MYPLLRREEKETILIKERERPICKKFLRSFTDGLTFHNDESIRRYNSVKRKRKS